MSLLDTALAVDFMAQEVGWRSFAAGSYDENGNFERGEASEQSIKAVLQPVKSYHLQDMPEGVREQAQLLIWTREQIGNDDIITYRGSEYRILHLWPRREGGFYRAAIGLLAPGWV